MAETPSGFLALFPGMMPQNVSRLLIPLWSLGLKVWDGSPGDSKCRLLFFHSLLHFCFPSLKTQEQRGHPIKWKVSLFNMDTVVPEV